MFQTLSHVTSVLGLTPEAKLWPSLANGSAHRPNASLNRAPACRRPWGNATLQALSVPAMCARLFRATKMVRRYDGGSGAGGAAGDDGLVP